MSWENILKNQFQEIDNFILEMKKINLVAQNTYRNFDNESYRKFGTTDSLEMKDLSTSIIDMGNAIVSLEKMRNKQEELR